MAAANALILDFDQSVLTLPGAESVALGAWQEQIRFGCTLDTLASLDRVISFQPTANRVQTVFIGSGDYHHVSHLLIQRYARFGQTFQVVVLDNHPDNMRYAFGIHCGSWVNQVSRLPQVSCVHVLGITSGDVSAAHAWENHLRPLRSGKVRYWCVGRKLGWMRTLGIDGSHSFESTSAMLDAFEDYLHASSEPIYLSIDKDVLSPQVVHTNWDQGVMRADEFARAVGLVKSRLIGCDVTGEVSVYTYKSRFKRWLSGLDGQPTIAATELDAWQREHQRLNRQLLAWLA
jgi:hypothetical protein